MGRFTRALTLWFFARGSVRTERVGIRNQPGPVTLPGRVEDWRRCSVGPAYPLLPVSVGVGIELGRANGEVEGSHSRPFGCEMAAHFHQRHVFRGPPIMPDGGISPVRFEVLAFPP